MLPPLSRLKGWCIPAAKCSLPRSLAGLVGQPDALERLASLWDLSQRFLASRSFAQRLRCATAIRLRPTAEMIREELRPLCHQDFE